jgi:RyR domain
MKVSERRSNCISHLEQQRQGSAVPNYTPKPIDTDEIELPEDLDDLTERLAENAHDHWALQRMAEGWRWGEARSDGAMTHPDLVPYGELPESEKEYDRKSAMETLKAILKLGYRIERS